MGNGINIHLGGKEYCNAEIIKRLLSNLNIKDYSYIFNHKIDEHNLVNLMYGLYREFKNIFKGKYDSFCNTNDERFTLNRIKKQYTPRTSMFDIGMEDYFFILKIYHNSFQDSSDLIKGTYDGLCWLLLDAIYNNGNIQKIHEYVSSSKRNKIRNIFGEFENIFTVNYDCNVEMISEKQVYYLHGDFNTLLDQYNPDTLIGRMYLEQGEINPSLRGDKHIYCNGIMGFTGSFKYDVITKFKNANLGIEKILEMVTVGLTKEDEEKIEQMKNSSDKKIKFAYNLIQTKLKYPNLSIHQYPSNIFESIIDELTIVGLSPNNDEHIWDIIRKNRNLKKIIYYYKGLESKKIIDDLYSDLNIITLPIEQFW